MKSIYKNPWFWGFVGLLLLFLWKSCGNGSIGFLGCGHSDTLSHKIDTIVTTKTDTIRYKPEEKIVYKPVYKWMEVPGLSIHDTLIETIRDYSYAPTEDTCKDIVEDWRSRRYYDDVLELSNGKVHIKDTLQWNMLVGREVSLETKDTSTHETTTILKHKFIVYIGAQTFGSKSDLFRGGFATLGFKGKNDVQFDLGIGRIRGSDDNQYMIGLKVPVRLFNIKNKKK